MGPRYLRLKDALGETAQTGQQARVTQPCTVRVLRRIPSRCLPSMNALHPTSSRSCARVHHPSLGAIALDLPRDDPHTADTPFPTFVRESALPRTARSSKGSHLAMRAHR